MSVEGYTDKVDEEELTMEITDTVETSVAFDLCSVIGLSFSFFTHLSDASELLGDKRMTGSYSIVMVDY